MKWLSGWLGARAQAKAQRDYRISGLSLRLIEMEQHAQALKEELALRNEELREERRSRDRWISHRNEAVQVANRLQSEVDRLRAQVANAEMDGPKRDLEKANDAQAARAMSRNTKQAFQDYQQAVKNVMEQFDRVVRQNSITKKDLDTINNVREQMRAIVKREL